LVTYYTGTVHTNSAIASSAKHDLTKPVFVTWFELILPSHGTKHVNPFNGLRQDVCPPSLKERFKFYTGSVTFNNCELLREYLRFKLFQIYAK